MWSCGAHSWKDGLIWNAQCFANLAICTDVDFRNRILFAPRERKNLQLISIDLNHRFHGEEEKKFKNEVKPVQFFGIRPVQVNICGIEMFVPYATGH